MIQSMWYKIVPMAKEHLPGIAAVEQASFSIPWSAAAFADELENPLAHYFVLLEEDVVRGYCGYWLVGDEGQITNIAVAPPARGQGFGKELLSHMIADAEQKGVTALFLEVRVSNLAARNLYRHFGFETVGLRPKYYSDNQEDALLMRRKIL